MSPRLLATSTLVLASLVGACRPAPEVLFASSLPRCYRLTVGPWKVPQREEYPGQRLVPPTPEVILLDPDRTEWLVGMPPDGDSPWRRLGGQSRDTLWTAYERTLPRRRWRVEGDSLFAQFTTFTGGLGLRFRVVGDSLLGKAEVVSDLRRVEYPTAPAAGIRVNCRRPQPSR